MTRAAMIKTPKVPAEADQSGRFKDAAVEVGVDLDEEKLKATLREIANPAKKPDEK